MHTHTAETREHQKTFYCIGVLFIVHLAETSRLEGLFEQPHLASLQPGHQQHSVKETIYTLPIYT